jgi:hypothetical protein
LWYYETWKPLRDMVLKGRLATIAAASLGKTVVVLTNELAVLKSDMLEEDDEEPLSLLPLSPVLQTRTEVSSTSMSMKVSNGPATIALLSRSMAHRLLRLDRPW